MDGLSGCVQWMCSVDVLSGCAQWMSHVPSGPCQHTYRTGESGALLSTCSTLDIPDLHPRFIVFLLVAFLCILTTSEAMP